MQLLLIFMLQDMREVLRLRPAGKKLQKFFTQDGFNMGIFLLLTHCQTQPGSLTSRKPMEWHKISS